MRKLILILLAVGVLVITACAETAEAQKNITNPVGVQIADQTYWKCFNRDTLAYKSGGPQPHHLDELQGRFLNPAVDYDHFCSSKELKDSGFVNDVKADDTGYWRKL